MQSIQHDRPNSQAIVDLLQNAIPHEEISICCVPTSWPEGGAIMGWRITSSRQGDPDSVYTAYLSNPENIEARISYIQGFAEQLEVNPTQLFWMIHGIEEGIDAYLAIHETTDPDPDGTRFRIRTVTSAQLDSGLYEVEYFIPYLLAKGLPAIVAGPQKSLKTSICAAMLIAIAMGRQFLGYFAEAVRHRVLFMSGESGFHTLQESARRICQADGMKLADVDRMLWSEQLPQFGNVAHIEETRRVIRDEGIELLSWDPCYLSMPGADAGNLFIQGELLREMSLMLREEKCSMLLIHHTKSVPAQRVHDPLELSDIAWAGFQEFARQWLLINRRKPFDPDSDGEHSLWLNVGSSAGHGGLWGVDITEGRRTATTARRWEVSVRKGSEVRDNDIQEHEHAKSDRKKREREAAAQTVYEDILQAFVHFPAGATKTKVRERVGQARAFDVAWMKACNSGELIECKVKGENGQEYDGWRRKYVSQE